jgi:predicted nucleic acid-binding protein
MLADAVVDASAIGAIIFAEPDGSRVQDVLQDRRLFAPDILTYEVVNIGLKKLRRGLGDTATITAALRLFEETAIAKLPVDPQAVFAVAQRHKLSAYDASYLWLAQRYGMSLITLDKALEAASRGEDH